MFFLEMWRGLRLEGYSCFLSLYVFIIGFSEAVTQRATSLNFSFYPHFVFPYFLLETSTELSTGQKVTKSQGLLKMAKNRQLFWLEETRLTLSSKSLQRGTLFC
ncbi:MAG: hypothetical protein CVU14_10990 [Bacteroidetes bacterium HGW-Bacteroidetes-9]|jgi:hypothetical protein|nr:MAG: hypothetical protein CVU14_10990 [Bacteroidetes bacterium HGW-Bacteroidetes-9]